MIDLAIVELKEKLINLSNESKMPPTLLAYIFSDMAQMWQNAASQMVNIQRQQRDEQEAKNQSLKAEESK